MQHVILTTMEQKRSFKLVEGIFTCTEATEVLFSLINSKIKFHELKSLGNKERFGTGDHPSSQRSTELKRILEEIRTLIARAEKEGVNLNISGDIVISYSKKKSNG